MAKLSDKTCATCGCPPNHETHILPSYREHNHDPLCCVEYLLPEAKRLKALTQELEEEIELHTKAQQAQPRIHAHVDGGWVWSNCPECGPDVRVDEEGCCVLCGRDALLYGKQEVTHA